MPRFAIAVFVAGALLFAPRATAQTISTAAGTGVPGYSGDSGPATSAQIDTAYGVAFDSLGNAYVADTRNHRIRKIAGGTITTVAGNGTDGFSGDGGAATAAALSFPRAVAVDSAGNLYISDTGNSRIRKVTPAGTISTFAGNGTAGFAGDGAAAASAELNFPHGLALDSAGNLYVADSWNFRVRKITAAGIIQTVAGNGSNGPFGDGGQATAASLGVVEALAFDTAGNLYLSDVYNHSVRKVTPAGVISTVAGGNFGPAVDGGAAVGAALQYPQGLAVDSQGNLFLSDSLNQRVRMISPAGVIGSVAGNGAAGYSGDGGPAALSQMNGPAGLALDSVGKLFVADTWNARVRSFTPGVNPSAAWLSVDVSHTGAFTQGQNGATYTVSVSNAAGAGASTGAVTVTETIPSGLTLVNMAGSGWVCAAGDTTCTRSDPLAAGASYPPIAVTVNVLAGAASPQVNSVSVSGGGSPSAADADSTPISNRPVLTVSKTHPGNFIQGQTRATFYVTVTNQAGAPATSGPVQVNDVEPTALSFVSMSGTGWNCSGISYCTRSDALDGGASYPDLVVKVSVAANATSPQASSAIVSGGGSVNATGTDAVAVGNPPVLTIASTNAGDFVQGQTSAKYTVSVSNQAGATATNGTATVIDTIPSGLTLVSISGPGWTCTSYSSTCTREDSLAGGSSYPDITVTVNVAASASSPQVNSVSISVGGGQASASATDSTTITPNPSMLTVTSTHSGVFVRGQFGAVYTVIVSNQAGAGRTSGAVTVTETIPSGLTVSYMTGTGWACPSGGAACTRTDGLAGGASYPAITVAVNVGANADSPQINSVSVSGGGSATANATDPTTVASPPALTVTKTHQGNFTQGQTGAAYSVIVSAEAGLGHTISMVKVDETLPAGLTLASSTGTGWTCVGTSCWRSDSLAGGQSYPPIAVTVNVAANAASPRVNQVSVSGGGASGASSTDSTTILTPPTLTIGKTHTGAFTQRQTGATYSIIVANRAGSADTSGSVTVTETVPSGLTLVSMSGAGWSCPAGGVACTRNDALAGGASYPEITVTVNVAANATSPQLNRASVAWGSSGSASATDSTAIAVGYAVGDVAPFTADAAQGFGDATMNIQDLIQVLFAVNNVPGFRPAACSDRFDAMDLYPVDAGSTRGGDGVLEIRDLIRELFRVNNLDLDRPVRASRGGACAGGGGQAAGTLAAAGGSIRPALRTAAFGELVIGAPEAFGDAEERVPVYLFASRDLARVALTFALGQPGLRLRYVATSDTPPSLLQDGQTGVVAAAWLNGIGVSSGSRRLLGYVAAPAGALTSLAVYGVSAVGLDDGREVRLSAPARAQR